MRTLVIGDVHGCAEELRRLLDATGAERAVLVGDLYTKGPDPAGVWRLVRDRQLDAVLGNHDQRLLDALDGRRPGDREAHACIEALDGEDPAWRSSLAALPLWYEDVEGWIVVHAGLHPTQGLAGTSRSMALSMRRWPEAEAHAPRWHETYDGERPVVFGHDAVGGLVWRTRAGRPAVVGLDTGCVYGGALSGLLLPDGVLVQVPAGAAHAPIGRGGDA